MKNRTQKEKMLWLFKLEVGLLALYSVVFGGFLMFAELTFSHSIQSTIFGIALVLLGEFLWLWVWMAEHTWEAYIGIPHVVYGIGLFALPIIGLVKGHSQDRRFHITFLVMMAIYHLIVEYRLLQIFNPLQPLR